MQSNEIIVKVNNTDICYDDFGTGSLPVLFIHGFPFDKSTWHPQMKALEKTTRVICYDIRGFGKSIVDNEQPSINLFADDLVKFMDILQIDKAIICGLSMGGYIALNACYRYSNRFAGIILCDTQCVADTAEAKAKRYETIKKIEEQGLNDFAEGFVKNIFTEATLNNNKALVDTIKKMILNTAVPTVTAALAALAERWETCSTLNEIKIPAMIICGKEDKVTPPAQSQFLHESIKGSTLQIIENAAHLSNLEQPEIMNGHLQTFIAKLSS